MKTAVITGASRGLGRYCAERLQQTGEWRVVGLARHPDKDAPFEQRPCDVADPNQVAAVFADLRRDRELFALINAAGIASMNLFLTTPVATMERIVAVNLLGTMYCCQWAAQAMIRRGEGRIINFSSIAVALGLAGEAAYVAAKAGIEGFSRSLARELAAHRITVNVIAPGPMATDLTARVPEEKLNALIRRQVVGRRAEPADLYGVLDFLLGESGAMISGQVMPLGGV